VGGDTESGSTLGDLIADPRAEDDEQRMLRRVGVGEQRRVLSERERVILRARFGIGGREHTLQDIGGRVGLSAERVRQIEQRALGKLRAAAEGPAAGQATASATSA
jgi:RNA polymerase sigma factor (sigma-70 family)